MNNILEKDKNIYHLGILTDYHFKFLIVDIEDVIEEVKTRLHLKNSSLLLVSKAMLGAFFIAAMVKDDMIVNLQLEGDGKIQRILSYSSRKGKMRGFAKNIDIQATPQDLTLGIGRGILKVTRWHSERRVHQSFTEMQSSSFEANLIKYIDQSEQALTFLSMSSSSGIIFQALGDTSQESKDKMLNKLNELDMDPETLFKSGIYSAMNTIEETLNAKFEVLETGVPEFQCNCSIEKIKNVIVALGKQEAFSILEEQGEVEMFCEFCKEQYVLDPEEVHLLFL